MAGKERAARAAAGNSIDVTARTYHTENGVAHAEGETYTVDDAILAETLYAIGFVAIDGWTPPPPESGSPPTRGARGGYLHDDRRDR